MKTFKLPTISAADLLAEPQGKEDDFLSSLSDPPDFSLGLSPPPSFGASAVPGGVGDPLVSALQQAGFKGQALKTAWAIGQRESGGRFTAHNPNRATGDDSYGPFQINMLGAMGPSRRKQFGISSNEDLYDPLVSAKAMYQMSHGGKDFGAWGIGPNAYRKMPALDYSGFPGGAAQTLPYKVPKGSINAGTYSGHGSHITDGLDLNHGQKTAVDIMAKPGTAVAAPRSGVVLRLGSAQGGDSMYFKDDNGYVWWLGHIDSRYSLPAGTRVRAGQTLSRISANHAAPHLHLDRTLTPTDRFG